MSDINDEVMEDVDGGSNEEMESSSPVNQRTTRSRSSGVVGIFERKEFPALSFCYSARRRTLKEKSVFEKMRRNTKKINRC